MRIFRLLLISAFFALLGGISLGAQAADDAIKVTSMVQVEIEVAGNDGKKTLARTPVEKAVPGTEVIYTTTFENMIKKLVGNIVINNPIPDNTKYKAGSAFGKDCEIMFSVDGGKHFALAENLKIKGTNGEERTALPKEYTDIRWIYKEKLAPGKFGEVGFRAVIK